jgi:hypothetical protein
MMSDALTVTTWNTQWATLKTERGRRVAAKLSVTDSDVIVVTESAHELPSRRRPGRGRRCRLGLQP